MLEPFSPRTPWSGPGGLLSEWAQRWLNLLLTQINSTLSLIGIKSLNGDTTPAQNLIAGANVTITGDGKGNHTIAAAGSTGSGITSINADSTAAQTFVNGTYIVVKDLGGGKHQINCTLTPSSGAILYGQFANDTVAAAAGVPVGGMYYNTDGFVVVRTT